MSNKASKAAELSAAEYDEDHGPVWDAYVRRRRKLLPYENPEEFAWNENLAEAGADPCFCQNCETTSRRDELFEIEDVWERVAYPIGHPACVVPSGECPECGSFAYDLRILEAARMKS